MGGSAGHYQDKGAGSVRMIGGEDGPVAEGSRGKSFKLCFSACWSPRCAVPATPAWTRVAQDTVRSCARAAVYAAHGAGINIERSVPQDRAAFGPTKLARGAGLRLVGPGTPYQPGDCRN